MGVTSRTLVIAGPTASGKSALASALATVIGGIVINADSMQLYQDLPILTARPSLADERVVPHALYGLWPADEQGSAGKWLNLVRPLLAQPRPLVLVGGTGLYLDALLNGIAAIPDIPPAIRGEVRALPHERLHQILATEDPAMADRLRPPDPQRLMRALEVIRATGRSLADWQADPRDRLALSNWAGVALLPPREHLIRRIERRLDHMLANGALDELQTFLADPASARSPLRKAVAVPELAAYLSGAASLDGARNAAVVATRRYAKRQVTYLRHRLSQLQPVDGLGDGANIQQQVAGLLQLEN